MPTKNIQDVVAEGVEESYTSHEALKEWEAEKDQNTLTQNIVALLGIHGMHCQFYKYQDASHITKAFESLFTQLVKEVEAGERERIAKVLMPIPKNFFVIDLGADQTLKKPDAILQALTPPTSDVIEE